MYLKRLCLIAFTEATTVNSVKVAIKSGIKDLSCVASSNSSAMNSGLKVSRPVDFGGGNCKYGSDRYLASKAGMTLPDLAISPSLSKGFFNNNLVAESIRVLAGPVSNASRIECSASLSITVRFAIPPKFSTMDTLSADEN